MNRVHISVPVKDLGDSLAFYQRLFGQEASKRRPDYANFRLETPPIHLALAPHQGPAVRAPGHFGIELPNHRALDLWRQRQDQQSASVRDQPAAQCCYAKGDKFWTTDPDGNQWEVWVRTGEADSLEDKSSQCCPSKGS